MMRWRPTHGLTDARGLLVSLFIRSLLLVFSQDRVRLGKVSVTKNYCGLPQVLVVMRYYAQSAKVSTLWNP